jgi:hypothetical protein
VKRVLLILSHAIEEHDQVKLLSGLGYDVFSLGGYIDPAHPHVDLRPPVDAPAHPDLKAVVDALDTDDNIGAAAQHIPDAILEWLGRDGIIIAHHYLEARIYPQWRHLRDWRRSGGRVIRRTVGQSVENNERLAAEFVRDGMETVRYSPYEQHIPGYTGADALIRFWADPVAYSGWTGAGGYVANVTQELWRRGVWCNADFARAAVADLPALFAGPGSKDGPVPGLGSVSYDDMRAYLREAGAYIYTGTQPASYTLGFLEALMTGVPIVSIGRSHMGIFAESPLLFEAPDWAWATFDDPADAQTELADLLTSDVYARQASGLMRSRAERYFHPDVVGAAWREYLG